MTKSENPILITGAAGFIGSFVVKKFIESGKDVIGIDNMNSYYDPKIKHDRLNFINNQETIKKGNFKFFNFSIEDKFSLDELFQKYNPKIVIHLAAQAGVRYSLSNPKSYIQSNIVGFSNILECCRNFKIRHLLYASSSSVYGGNKKMPYKETQTVDHPVSLYAATKKSNELMAHTYSHLFDIPSTGLRFFTVYGPWGRPDMAPIIFSKAMIKGEAINIFNHGKMLRDFTYISDIVEAVYKCTYKIPSLNKSFDYYSPDNSSSFAPYRIFNIGNNKPVSLLRFIEILEDELGIKANKKFLPLQPGDVIATYADTSLLNDWINFAPKVSIEQGVQKFVKWFKNYY